MTTSYLINHLTSELVFIHPNILMNLTTLWKSSDIISKGSSISVFNSLDSVRLATSFIFRFLLFKVFFLKILNRSLKNRLLSIITPHDFFPHHHFQSLFLKYMSR